MTAPTTKVLMVDDHLVVREGLRGMMKAEIGRDVDGSARLSATP